MAVAYRVLVTASMAALTLAVIVDSQPLRAFEAWLASHVVAAGTGAQTGHDAGLAMVWFVLQTDQVALQITRDCTVAVLIAPFLAVTGVLVWLRRTASARPVLALAVTLPLLILINQSRILIIVWLMEAFGPQTGFYWGHAVAGSLLTIAGMAVCILIYASLVKARRTAQASDNQAKGF
jgi:exosortase/archaeosortase family protein